MLLGWLLAAGGGELHVGMMRSDTGCTASLVAPSPMSSHTIALMNAKELGFALSATAAVSGTIEALLESSDPPFSLMVAESQTVRGTWRT